MAHYDVNGNPIEEISSAPHFDVNGNPLDQGADVSFAQQQANRAQPAAPPSSFMDRLKMAMTPRSGTVDPKEVTSLIPMLGAMAAPETGGLSLLGAGAGSLLKQGLNEKIDKSEPSWGQSAQETGADIVGQAVLPKVLGMAFTPRLTVAKAL